MTTQPIFAGAGVCRLSTSNGLPHVFVYAAERGPPNLRGSSQYRSADYSLTVHHASKALYAGRSIGPRCQVHPGFDTIDTEKIRQLCELLFPGCTFEASSNQRWLEYGFNRYNSREYIR